MADGENVDFSFDKEEEAVYETIFVAAKKRLNENVFKDDEEGVFSREKWEVCSDIGVIGLPIPKKYGGLEKSMTTTAIGVNALAKGCGDEGLVFSLCAHMCTCAIPILIHGTEEQKERYLPDIVYGRSIGGNGMTETEAGSDISSINTKVIKQDESYLINGSKIFVTNAPVADVLLIYARHEDGIRMANISCFLIERKSAGWKIGQLFQKMGLRTSTIGEVVLNDCRLSIDSLIGRERYGIRVFNDSMMWERIIMSAYHVGAMERQFDSVLDYASERKQFGSRIIEYQDIAGKIVDMSKRIECSRLSLYQSCWKYDRGKADLGDAAMTKLITSESKVKNSLEAIQIFGAYGYMKGSEVEKQLRDSIASKIYSGTSEMQRRIIVDRIKANRK